MDNPYTSPGSDIVQPGSSLSGDGHLTGAILEHLRRTRPWVMFLAILGFIGTGLMMLAGVAMFLIFSVLGFMEDEDFSPGMGIGLGAGIGGIYLAMGVVALLPSLKLWKYSSRIANLMRTSALSDLEDAMDQQRAFWKICGIVVIVSFALNIVFSIGFALVGTLVPAMFLE